MNKNGYDVYGLNKFNPKQKQQVYIGFSFAEDSRSAFKSAKEHLAKYGLIVKSVVLAEVHQER
jgi:hypothetical protein